MRHVLGTQSASGEMLLHYQKEGKAVPNQLVVSFSPGLFGGQQLQKTDADARSSRG